MAGGGRTQLTGLVDSGCAFVSSAPFALAMTAAGALGDGLLGAGVAAFLIAFGAWAGRARTRRTGVTALIAVLASGLLAVALKAIFQLPRPDASAVTFAFPSGHATTAFALAGVLGYALPAWGPLTFFVAVLAGVARVYYRAHFLLDVAGGALLGTTTGFFLARALLGAAPGRSSPRGRAAAWVLASLAILPLVVFFFAYERALAAHQVVDVPADLQDGVVVRFGSENARSHLGQGWSGDERWTSGFPMIWVEGREADVVLPGLPPADHQLRLRLHPFAGGGRPSCQNVSVAVNGEPIATVWLDTGWRWYAVDIPRGVLGGTSTKLHFQFARAARPSDYGSSADLRLLSAAFAMLQAVPSDPGR